MIISKTPFRISFAGGGTDLREYYQEAGYGAVVSMAISKYLYVTVNRRFDSTVRVAYTDIEIVDKVSELKHAIIKACLDMVGIDDSIEITTVGEVPAGTGLGSSSALTVGVLNALYAYKGMQLSAGELANRACEIEMDVLKKPIGKQDQVAAAYGGLNYFRFNADETIQRERIWLSDTAFKIFERKLLMFYTGGRKSRSSDEILKEQGERSMANKETLDAMRSQADTLFEKLRDGHSPNMLGPMMDSGWKLKRTVAGGISNPDIDMIYERGIAAGALGGKLLGAGGGGFMLFFCDESEQPQLREVMSEELGLREMGFHLANFGSNIVNYN